MAGRAPQVKDAIRYIAEQMQLVNTYCELGNSNDLESNLATLGEMFKNEQMKVAGIESFGQLLEMCLQGGIEPLAEKAVDIISTGVRHFASKEPNDATDPFMPWLLERLNKGVFSFSPLSPVTAASINALAEIVQRRENAAPVVFSIFTHERLAQVDSATFTAENGASAYWFLAQYLISHDLQNIRMEKLRSVVTMVEKFLLKLIDSCDAVNAVCEAFITFLQAGFLELVDELLPQSGLIRLLVDHSRSNGCARTCHNTIYLIQELFALGPNCFSHMIQQGILHIVFVVLRDVPAQVSSVRVLRAACEVVEVILTHPSINSIDEINNSRVMNLAFKLWSNEHARETAIKLVNLFIVKASVLQLHQSITAGMLDYLSVVINGASPKLKEDILKILKLISSANFNAAQKRSVKDRLMELQVPDFLNAPHDPSVRNLVESIRVFLTS